MFNLEDLLTPLSDSEPCGPDLEYDASFGEMERAAQEKAEQVFGDTVVEAEPADWREVRKHVDDLLSRTKDMRVAVYLIRCLVHSDGLTGIENGLALLRGYVEGFWPEVHPMLDPEDDDDPTFRVNTLAILCDQAGFLKDLQECPLVSSRVVGQFGLKEISEAEDQKKSETDSEPVSNTDDDWGSNESSEESPKSSGPTREVINAAFTDIETETLLETAEAVRLSADHVAAIESVVTAQVGAYRAVSLKPLHDLYVQMLEILQMQMERLGVYQDEPTDSEDGEQSADGNDEGEQALQGGASQEIRLTGKLVTRDDAIKALDRVCEYFERNEPSSPLPLLIRRAQRLASKSFLDIIRDLAPEAVSQAEAWGGGAGPILERSESTYPSDSSRDDDDDDDDDDDNEDDDTW